MDLDSGDPGLELWLVRHGETTRSRDGRLAGRADVRLTPRGREQARRLRPILAAWTFTGAWTSDMERARATARLAWAGPVRADSRLREVDFGTLEGAHVARLEPSMATMLGRFDGFAFPGGEDDQAARSRVSSFVASLGPGRHLVFTHGGVIRLLTASLGEDRFLPTGSVAIIDWSGRRLRRLVDSGRMEPC